MNKPPSILCPHQHSLRALPAADRARPAVFLDRDGTLVRGVEYLADPNDLALLPGVGEALRRMRDAGRALVVCTNQSGVARGCFDLERLAAIHERFLALLAAEDVALDGLYFCPHHPEGVADGFAGECDHRKPAPGMLLAAAAALGIDLRASWMVGDSRRADLAAGRAAGCRTAYVGRNLPAEADVIAASVLEAVPAILRR